MAYKLRIEPADDGDTLGHIYINFDRSGRVDLEDADGHIQTLGTYVADDDEPKATRQRSRGRGAGR